jgi:hypothetical protein
MLKANVNDKETSVEICGSLQDICVDLTRILSAINEKLSDKDHELGHMFRVMFTKGFMDGLCFDDDREHMEHYLAEGDRNVARNKKKSESFAEFVEGFIDFLKERHDELEKANEELKKQLGKENEDEAE